MSDMTADPIEVFQSSESASKFTVQIGEREIVLTFLSSKKGRIDFSTDIDGTPKGKVNLLSQHSIARFVSSAGVVEGEKQIFKDTLLQVGVIIRDAKYTPAPEVLKVPEIDKYLGQDSTLGVVDSDTMKTFLSDELLLDKINKILHESRDTPFIGDDANLILTFLVIMSCKTDNPLNLEMVATSAAGKTYMVLTARNGVPKSMCMVLAGASKEALKYDYDEIDDDGNFIIHVDNKCIIVLEKDDSYSFVRKMKPLMSGDDDELIWKTPIKNDLTGEIETRDFIIRGQPSFITLTTRNPTEQEQITRTLLMTPDTTAGKVSAVVRNSLIAKANPDQFKVHKDLTLLQASMLSLKKYRVRNIFAPQMAEFFPARSAQHQRDIGKVLSIIDSITLLHQNQRPIETNTHGDEFLLSSIEDNIIGLILADLVLRASLSGVPDDSWATFTQMIKMDDSNRALTIDNILQWLHLHAFSLSKNALTEKHLPTLEDSGLIEVAKRGGGRGGRKKTYRIVKTRKGLMDTYSLTPLFVEGIRNSLADIIFDYKDVINSLSAPESVRNLEKGEGHILKGFGCENKKQSQIWRSLFLPTYFRPQNINSMLSKVIGAGEQKDILFSGQAWLDSEIEAEATSDLEKHRDMKEKVREASKVHVEADDNDVWDALMETHHLEDGF
jgi:hypothetical protein